MYNKDPFQDFDKSFDRGIKAAKAVIITIVIGSLVVVGLISWVVIHFLAKVW